MTRALFFLALLTGAVVTGVAQESSAALTEARALYHARKSEEARKAFAALAKTEPNNAEVYFHLGLLDLRADDPKAATVHLERAVELAPGSAEYWRRLGDAYGTHAQRASLFSKPGLAKKCLRAYESAVAADPTHVNARWSLKEFYKHAPGFMGGGMDKARNQADEIAKLDPVGGRWAHALLLLQEEKYDDGLALYADALTTEPPDYAALYQLGRLAEWTGHDLERGKQALTKCLTLEPKAWAGSHKEVHVALGTIHEKLNDQDAARAAYQAALALDPEFKPALEALAKLDGVSR